MSDLPIDILFDLRYLLLQTVLLLLMKVLRAHGLQFLLLSQQPVPGHGLLPLSVAGQFRECLAPLFLIVLLGLGKGGKLSLKLYLNSTRMTVNVARFCIYNHSNSMVLVKVLRN